MPDLAELELRIDSRGVDEADRRLDRLAGTADRTAVRVASLLATFLSLRQGFGILINYERELVAVGKTTDILGDQLDALGERFIGLSTRVPQSVASLLRLGAAAGQLGVRSSADILAFAETIAKLEASTEDLGGTTAALTLARLLGISREAPSQVGLLANVIVRLGNNLRTTEGQIADFGLRVAQAANVFRFTSAQSAALGAALSSAGAEAEAASTAVSRTLQTLDRAARGQGEALALVARVAGETREVFGALVRDDPFQALFQFLEGLAPLGRDAIDVLDQLGIADVRTSRTLLALSGDFDTLRLAVQLANDELVRNSAADIESARAFGTLESRIQVARNSISAMVLELRESTGGFSDFLAGVRDGVVVLLDLDEELIGTEESARTFATGINLATTAVAALATSQAILFVQQYGRSFLGAASGAGALAAGLGGLTGALTDLGTGIRTTTLLLVGLTGVPIAQRFVAAALANRSLNDALGAGAVALARTTALEQQKAAATAASAAQDLAATERAIARQAIEVRFAQTTAVRFAATRRLVDLELIATSQRNALAVANLRLAAAETTAAVAARSAAVATTLFGRASAIATAGVRGLTAAISANPLGFLIVGLSLAWPLMDRLGRSADDANENIRRLADGNLRLAGSLEAIERARNERRVARRDGDRAREIQTIQAELEALRTLQVDLEAERGRGPTIDFGRIRIASEQAFDDVRKEIRDKLVAAVEGAVFDAGAPGGFRSSVDAGQFVADSVAFAFRGIREVEGIESPLADFFDLSRIRNVGAELQPELSRVAGILTDAARGFEIPEAQRERVNRSIARLVDASIISAPINESIDVVDRAIVRLRALLDATRDLNERETRDRGPTPEQRDARRGLNDLVSRIALEQRLSNLKEDQADIERVLLQVREVSAAAGLPFEAIEGTVGLTRALLEQANAARAARVEQERLDRERAEAVDDLNAYLAALDEEARFIGLSADAQERERAAIEVANLARRAGVEDVDALVASVRKQITASQQLAAVTDRLNELERQRQGFVGQIESGFVDTLRFDALQNEAAALESNEGRRRVLVEALELERLARAAGLSNVDALVDAYKREADELRRLTELRQFSNDIAGAIVSPLEGVALQIRDIDDAVQDLIRGVAATSTRQFIFEPIQEGLAASLSGAFQPAFNLAGGPRETGATANALLASTGVKAATSIEALGQAAASAAVRIAEVGPTGPVLADAGEAAGEVGPVAGVDGLGSAAVTAASQVGGLGSSSTSAAGQVGALGGASVGSTAEVGGLGIASTTASGFVLELGAAAGLAAAALAQVGAQGAGSGVLTALQTVGPATIPFARGGAFGLGGNEIPFGGGGGVFDGPTPFTFDGGRQLGVAGEVEEAVLPLLRGPSGRLGVEMNVPPSFYGAIERAISRSFAVNVASGGIGGGGGTVVLNQYLPPDRGGTRRAGRQVAESTRRALQPHARFITG